MRIDYLGPTGNRTPAVTVAADDVEGSAPLTVQFTSTVADPEGRRLKYAWDFDVLGHDTHGHPLSTASGCSGSITTSVAGGHDPATQDINAVFSASYTDAGSGNLPPLTGTDQVVIEPVAP